MGSTAFTGSTLGATETGTAAAAACLAGSTDFVGTGEVGFGGSAAATAGAGAGAGTGAEAGVDGFDAGAVGLTSGLAGFAASNASARLDNPPGAAGLGAVGLLGGWAALVSPAAFAGALTAAGAGVAVGGVVLAAVTGALGCLFERFLAMALLMQRVCFVSRGIT